MRSVKLGRMLVCPVRGCGLALARHARRVACSRGHSFDIARSGYINLLQPQDRRSKEPGDTAAAVGGRRRLHDLGVTAPFLEAIAEFAGVLGGDIVLDAGCGDGFYLGGLARRSGISGHGVDISLAAIDSAARRYPECEWIVANADRFIPYAGDSFSLIMSITGRMDCLEFRRVLRNDGRLLVALAAPDDLIELRKSGRDRVERTVEGLAGSFTLTRRRRVRAQADLDAAAVSDVLHSIYRPMRERPVEGMRVTLSLDLLMFRPIGADVENTGI